MKSSIQRGTADRAGHDPRTAALRIVDKVLSGTEASQALLDKGLRESSMVPSDKGLCTELVYGYLRWAARLDWDLGRFLRDPSKLPAEMRLILGLAAYEIAFLTRIPAHASVNWAVTRVRNRFGKGLGGVANGALRSFARDMKTAGDTRFSVIPDTVQRLAVVHALPEWVVRLWFDAYGEEAAMTFMRASSSQAIPALRVNAGRSGAADVLAGLCNEPGAMKAGSWGVAFPGGAPYSARKLERDGLASFQSPGVQDMLAALDMPAWQGPVWDACAGRGGKTAAMLECGVCVRLATDMNYHRIAGLPPELERLGLDVSGLSVAQADAAGEAVGILSEGVFATILADVPCSGLGTLSRRPEIRFRRAHEDIPSLTASQDAILDAAARRLLPGGRIVYVTCTINPVENEDRVHAFLSRHTEFSLVREWRTPRDTPWNEFFYAAILGPE